MCQEVTTHMIRYLDSKQAAHRLGIHPVSVRRARAEGRAPEPDAMTGNQPGWLPQTIDKWAKARDKKDQP